MKGAKNARVTILKFLELQQRRTGEQQEKFKLASIQKIIDLFRNRFSIVMGQIMCMCGLTEFNTRVFSKYSAVIFGFALTGSPCATRTRRNSRYTAIVIP
jgi:NADH:ubiquinone oxidoreductase subunit B-like Fe-S oxidoreductase